MRRITPTQWAEEGGRRDKRERLGSRLELIDALPVGALVVVGRPVDRESFQETMLRVGAGTMGFRFAYAEHGVHGLEGFPKSTVVGVDRDAELAVREELRASFLATLNSFEKVLWA